MKKNWARNKITQVVILLWGCAALLLTNGKVEEKTVKESASTRMAPSSFMKKKIVQNSPLQIDEMLAYEVCFDGGRKYLAVTGIREQYQEEFKRYLSAESDDTSGFSVPDKIDGVFVEEIAADAFRDVDGEITGFPKQLRIVGDRAFLNTKINGEEITFPKEMEQIGEEAFSNCGIKWAEFPGEKNPTIGKRAFVNNESMWGIYFPSSDCVIGEDAFAGCEEKFYLGYEERPAEGRNLAAEYADANGLRAIWVPVIDSLEPIVKYPEAPIVLTPKIGNFFYGENGEGELCLSCEEADDAPDYGYSAWHAPCGEWCVGSGFLEITASSELSSANGRYAAANLYALSGREHAWAEGVEGVGIGESITYHDCNIWHVNNRWEYLGYEEWYQKYENLYNPLDGYIRYTEICIVNGYARDQKVWEENGRVKKLLMYVEDKPYAYLELEDTIKPQYFMLPWEDIMVADGGEITFRFVIEDVYPGTVYEDTCLTGLVIEFTGRRGH